MQHFIPERDELLFAPAPIGKLVPYRIGLPCLHWEAAIVDADNEDRIIKVLTSEDEEAARSGDIDQSVAA